jgi:AcrR family transcriptional regulator
MRYRERDSKKSREDILKSAELEFAAKGIYGTRVDEIAKNARINKRMIYEYFGSKEELYKAVLARSYSRLSRDEMMLLSKEIPPVEAIGKIVRLYFEFLNSNPEYVNLIMWENLNQGKYLEDIDFGTIKHPAFEMLRHVLQKGRDDKIFRSDLDDDQLIISLLTFTFSYFSNRYTLSKLFSTKLDASENINKRINYVTDMFLEYICM